MVNAVNSIETFYSDLRKLKEGKLAIFLGAGASFDYGIPTMNEMAKMLVEELKKPSSEIFDKDSADVIKTVIGLSEDKKDKSSEDNSNWNIEDLLTRLHRIQDAIGDRGSPFPEVKTKIGTADFSKEKMQQAELQLTKFIVACYQLDSCEKTSHGDRSIEYLSDFVDFLGGFHNSLSIFTTNNDLCIETAIMRLSQLSKSLKKRECYLIDGFSHGVLPVFSISNFSLIPPKSNNRVVVYLWKLHGSVDWTYTNPINDDTGSNVNFHDESIICRYIPPNLWTDFQKAGAVSKHITIDQSRIMIFPTPSKYSQTYNTPYMDLYQAFRGTLEKAELLVIVGTSFPDSHINSAIKSFLNIDNTMLYVVDPQITRENICKILGDCNAIQPVIKKSFKEFIRTLIQIETSKETDKEIGQESRQDE